MLFFLPTADSSIKIFPLPFPAIDHSFSRLYPLQGSALLPLHAGPPGLERPLLYKQAALFPTGKRAANCQEADAF